MTDDELRALRARNESSQIANAPHIVTRMV